MLFLLNIPEVRLPVILREIWNKINTRFEKLVEDKSYGSSWKTYIACFGFNICLYTINTLYQAFISSGVLHFFLIQTVPLQTNTTIFNAQLMLHWFWLLFCYSDTSINKKGNVFQCFHTVLCFVSLCFLDVFFLCHEFAKKLQCSWVQRKK